MTPLRTDPRRIPWIVRTCDTPTYRPKEDPVVPRLVARNLLGKLSTMSSHYVPESRGVALDDLRMRWGADLPFYRRGVSGPQRTPVPHTSTGGDQRGPVWGWEVGSTESHPHRRGPGRSVSVRLGSPGRPVEDPRHGPLTLPSLSDPRLTLGSGPERYNFGHEGRGRVDRSLVARPHRTDPSPARPPERTTTTSRLTRSTGVVTREPDHPDSLDLVCVDTPTDSPRVPQDPPGPLVLGEVREEVPFTGTPWGPTRGSRHPGFGRCPPKGVAYTTPGTN